MISDPGRKTPDFRAYNVERNDFELIVLLGFLILIYNKKECRKIHGLRMICLYKSK